MAQYTPNDPMAKPMLYGGLALLGTTVFVLVSNLMHTIDKNSTKGAADTSMALAVAEQNLAPVGSVTTVDKSIVKEARTGEAVFNAVCTSCHSAGVLGAPKIDDKAAWEPRVAQGLDGLLKNAQNGKNSMPARGGDPTITDEELTNAIIYMTGKAGIDLKAGAAAPAAAAPAAAAPAAATPAAAAPAAAAAPDAATLAAGEKVFNAVCTACHTAGVLNAPKLDDKAAWEPRIAQGLDGLLNSAKNGKNAMPAKGGNPALTDEELTNAILYMTNKAGISLAAPAAAAPAAQAAPAAAAPAAQAAPAAAAPAVQAAPAAAAPAAQAAPAAAAPAAQAAPAAAIDGEKVYKSTCFACHDVGVANAPKLGDKAAWDARVATGKDALYSSALQGKNVMPAKGGNANLSDDEVKAAVDYMVGKAQ